jgi:autotransporter-associated beta strand protein
MAVWVLIATTVISNASGADGTWTNLAGGAWSTVGNWLSGTVATGTDAIADFSTLNLTANAVVDNDAPRTVGTLRFGDTTPGNDWTLQNAALTLAVSSGTPTVTVANRTATISSALLGTQGFTKNGAGTLRLNKRGSTMAGDMTVNQGMLINTLGGLRDTSGTVIVSPGATLYVTSDWGPPGSHEMTNSISLSGTGTGSFGALHGQANFSCNGPITLLTDSKITHDWNTFTFNGAISGTDKNLILQAGVSGQPGISVNSSMSLGIGALSVTGDTYVYLNAANSYSGGTTVGTGGNGGVQIGHVNALGSGGLTVHSGRVNLNTRSVSLASLSGSGGIITDTGAAGTTTLTVTQSVATTYSGVISNGASRVVALTKTGSGTLTLAGRNTYSGATTINAGGLVGVTGGSCLNSSVIVADGASNGVQVAAFGGQWACSNLTYSTGTTTLDINFGSAMPSTTIAPLLVVSNLNMGTVGISVRNGIWPATPGTYPLVSYSGDLSGTVPGTPLVLPSGLTATIVNNTGSKRIDLNVTAVAWSPSSYNTWTNLVSGNASGSWGNSANWSNNFPHAVDAIADFSTLNITADAFVNNDAPHTVGQVRFGDTSPSHNWTLTNAALTLATTLIQPVIDVSNQTVTVNSILQGTQGFVKQGSGTLTISGKSTMAGDITVSQGMLINTLGGLRNTTGNVIVSAGATLFVRSGWGANDGRYEMTNPIFLSGTGVSANIGALHEMENMTFTGPITLLTHSKITHDWNDFTLNGPISGTDKNLELGVTVGGQYPIRVNGSVNLGAGALTIDSVQNGGSGDGCAVALNAANIYSGGTVLTNYAILRIGNAGALGSGGVTFSPNSKLNLNTFNATVGGLSGPGGIITDDGAAGTTTLTVNQSTNTTYSGVITNGANRVLALVKTGSGLLTLSGTNTYTGATAVSNGTLAVSGALSSSGVTVCTGAAFAAGTTGVVGRATLGGTLAFENNSRLLVDVASTTADAASAVGNVTLTGTVTLEVSGDQTRGGSWKVLESTGGTITGSFVLAGARSGSFLAKSTDNKEVWLNIPRPGTMIRIF